MQVDCRLAEKSVNQAVAQLRFEEMPQYLKAGFFYSPKLEFVRCQTQFHPKQFAYELIVQEGHKEFSLGNYNLACRKYEEAYSIWRYYKSSSTESKFNQYAVMPNISGLEEVDWQGRHESDRKTIIQNKIQSLLNMSACNIKTQCFDKALAVTSEILRTEPDNQVALWRRAKALAAPINAKVPDFKDALVDLGKLVDQNRKVKIEISRLKALIDRKSLRYAEAYSRVLIQRGDEKSLKVAEEIKQMTGKESEDFNEHIEDKTFDLEMLKIDQNVSKLIWKTRGTLNFEINETIEYNKDVEELTLLVDNSIKAYRSLKKQGKIKQAKAMKKKLSEAKFQREHLIMVMNLDFTKPTDKMKQIAEKTKINLQDPRIIDEFKIIQKQNLEDIRRWKRGEPLLTPEEQSVERLKYLADQEEINQTKIAQLAYERALETQEKLRQFERGQLRDILVLIPFIIFWLFAVIYQNWYVEDAYIF